jgi:hypothetical protein
MTAAHPRIGWIVHMPSVTPGVHMGVDLRGLDVAVAKSSCTLLRSAPPSKDGCKAVSQGMHLGIQATGITISDETLVHSLPVSLRPLLPTNKAWSNHACRQVPDVLASDRRRSSACHLTDGNDTIL